RGRSAARKASRWKQASRATWTSSSASDRAASACSLFRAVRRGSALQIGGERGEWVVERRLLARLIPSGARLTRSIARLIPPRARLARPLVRRRRRGPLAPHREADLLLLAVHLDDAHLDLVADLHDGVRVLHELVGEPRNVDQPVL